MLILVTSVYDLEADVYTITCYICIWASGYSLQDDCFLYYLPFQVEMLIIFLSFDSSVKVAILPLAYINHHYEIFK